MIRKIKLMTVLTVLCLVVLTGCSQDGKTKGSGDNVSEIKPIATIELESGEKMVLELYPQMAPNTVNNFIELANSGFYDGVVFHRAVENFMIQGGDPTGTGSGGPGYSIHGEFSSNGFKANTLSHTEGVISMARAQSPDSAGSQFFIVTGNASFLDGSYAGFGKVIDGYEVAVKISKMPTTSEQLNDKVVIKSITVDTLGETFPSPEKTK